MTLSIDKNRQGDYHLNIWKNELKIKCKQLINIRIFPEVIHIAEHRRIYPRKINCDCQRFFLKYNAHVIYRGYNTCSVLISHKYFSNTSFKFWLPARFMKLDSSSMIANVKFTILKHFSNSLNSLVACNYFKNSKL